MAEGLVVGKKRDQRAAAFKAWETRRRKQQEAPKDRASGVSRGDWTDTNAGRERSLKASPVSKIKPLGGGISETYKVTLADGTEANCKVSNTPEGEVASWEVAKLVGLDDMVPPAVIRTMDVPGNVGVGSGRTHHAKKGARVSLAFWQPGERAGDVLEREFKKGRGGNMNAHFGDSDEDVKRAAMFDFITMNCDRHEGNWVVDKGKIRMIDHNLSFGGYSFSELFRRTLDTSSNLSPAKYASEYVKKKSQIVDACRRSGLSDEQVNRVAARIDLAASAGAWKDLDVSN